MASACSARSLRCFYELHEPYISWRHPRITPIMPNYTTIKWKYIGANTSRCDVIRTRNKQPYSLNAWTGTKYIPNWSGSVYIQNSKCLAGTQDVTMTSPSTNYVTEQSSYNTLPVSKKCSLWFGQHWCTILKVFFVTSKVYSVTLTVNSVTTLSSTLWLAAVYTVTQTVWSALTQLGWWLWQSSPWLCNTWLFHDVSSVISPTFLHSLRVALLRLSISPALLSSRLLCRVI